MGSHEYALPSTFRVGEAATRAVAAAHREAAALLAARTESARRAVLVDPREAFAAFRSERYLRLDGQPIVAQDPLTADYQTSDGWIRLHCNFRHHAEIACRALGIPFDGATRESVAAAVARRGKYELEDAITVAGGAAAAMRTREEWLAHPQSAVIAGRIATAAAYGRSSGAAFESSSAFGGGAFGGRASGGGASGSQAASVAASGASALTAAGGSGVSGSSAGSAGSAGSGLSGGIGFATGTASSSAPLAMQQLSERDVADRRPAWMERAERPLAGVRVLDLTRIIAGPVAGRVLAGYGADVTMIRAEHLPTLRSLDLDTSFGKTRTFLDLRAKEDRAAFLDMVRSTDVVLQSYRPGALAHLGLSAEDLAEVRPGLVHVSVSAYGTHGPWAGKRGFDSLVQMASGIADEGMRTFGAPRPVPLPAQVLDHAAGWTAAAGTIRALRNRSGDRASWNVSVSLAGMAHWLDGLGRLDPAEALAAHDPTFADVRPYLLDTPSDAGLLTHVRMPGDIDGVPLGWSCPPPS